METIAKDTAGRDSTLNATEVNILAGLAVVLFNNVLDLVRELYGSDVSRLLLYGIIGILVLSLIVLPAAKKKTQWWR